MSSRREPSGSFAAESAEAEEKLIRVLATRRGMPIELSVHYEIIRRNRCNLYRLLTIQSTGTG